MSEENVEIGPRNTNYRRGAAFELRVQKRLEDRGFFVIRSAGSKTLCDLLALPKGGQGRPMFVQCKSGKRGMSKREIMEFKDFCEEWNVTPLLAERGMKFRFLLDEDQLAA